MKKIIVLLLLAFNVTVYSQDLPTDSQNGFMFPLGSKFTIKLHQRDSISFDYSIIEFESYEDVVDTWENDHLFKEKGEKGTIEFCFCLGTSGENEKDREKNMKVLLLIKNKTDYSLNYNSEIQIEEGGEFQETSNVGTHSGVKGVEMWPYMIYQIGLIDFRLME